MKKYTCQVMLYYFGDLSTKIMSMTLSNNLKASLQYAVCTIFIVTS